MKFGVFTLTFGLALSAIGLGFVTAPGTLERLAMLIRDGRFEAAASLGTDVYKDGQAEPELLARVFDLNSHAGDPDLARRAIQDYLAVRPADAPMLRRAAEFFEHQQDLDALIDILRRLVALGDTAAIEHVARIYRLYGRFEEEKQLLLEHRNAALSPALAIRTAGLLARDGAYAEAAAMLRNHDGDPAAAESQPLLFEVLVRSAQTAEATDRATRWVAAELDSGLHALFVLTLALAGSEADALRLATADRPDGQDPSSLAWALGERGHLALAQAVIEDWLVQTDAATARRATRLYVDLALSTGSLGQELVRLHEALSSREPAVRTRAAALSAMLFERQGYAAIAPVRQLLTPDILMQEPLFAAALSLQEANFTAARYFLLSCDLALLDDEEVALWNGVAAEVFTQQETANVLLAHWRDGSIAPAMLPSLQEAAVRSARFDPAWEILESFPTFPVSDPERVAWSR